jgi:hypothetical protein
MWGPGRVDAHAVPAPIDLEGQELVNASLSVRAHLRCAPWVRRILAGVILGMASTSSVAGIVRLLLS